MLNKKELNGVKKICGIYSIQHIAYKKRYIGQSRDINKRINDHIKRFSKSKIHRAIAKYGADAFSFEIIEECSIDNLNRKEVSYISKFNCINDGYNLTSGGERDYSISGIVKNKISTSQKKKYKKTDYLDRFNSISFSGGKHKAEILNVRLKHADFVSFSKHQASNIFKHMCKDKNCSCNPVDWDIKGGCKDEILRALFGELH